MTTRSASKTQFPILTSHPDFSKRCKTFGCLMASSLLMATASSQTIELSNVGTTQPGFVINGTEVDEDSSFCVSGAGDVNGDGLSDLIVGTWVADPNENGCHVVFGKSDGNPVNLGALGNGGFGIRTDVLPGQTGFRVSSAGDVNADGLADLIVSAQSATPGGQCHVVFGKSSSTLVELTNLSGQGFTIRGSFSNGQVGAGVSGAGDINGDGLSDLLVGGPVVNSTGEGYVIFGKADSATVETSALGTGGFSIKGIAGSDSVGFFVSGVGDVNGDGIGDVMLGAPYHNPGGIALAGASFIVFGKSDSASVELSALGSGGFYIPGCNFEGYFGYALSGAGDVNGDGLSDLVAASPATVIFGRASTSQIDLTNLGSGGFVMSGAQTRSGVAGAGDLNGDGLTDVLVGFMGGVTPGGNGAGKTFAVFGKTNPDPVTLSAMGSGGLTFNGVFTNDRSGRSVSGAGDVNGDGSADIIIGAWEANPNGVTDAGQSYVVFSPAPSATTASYKSFTRIGNAPRQAIGICGDGSNDNAPDSRAWIDFDAGDDGSGGASLLNVTLSRNNSSITNLSPAANVMWEIDTDRAGWSSAALTFRYTDAEIAGLTESNLIVYHGASPSGPWIPLATTIDAARNTASASVASFSFFALAEATASVSDWGALEVEHSP